MRIRTFRLGPPPAGGGVAGFFSWMLGLVVGGVTLVLGAIFALSAAVAVALLAVFAGVAVFAARLMRGRRMVRPASAGDGAVLDARKVGDQWVAYGFDSQAR